MKTRLLRPEENWKSNLTMAVAFEGDYDLEKAKESAARERTEEEKREDARNRCFCTFLDDDETICGVVNSREYLCRFDGGTYKLGGVGGVSTLPQYRRGGVIRACVTASLKDMYANDFTFAFLYPFSMQYYRKFGFEAGAPEYRWSVPFTAMKPQDVGGHVEQIFPILPRFLPSITRSMQTTTSPPSAKRMIKVSKKRTSGTISATYSSGTITKISRAA